MTNIFKRRLDSARLLVPLQYLIDGDAMLRSCHAVHHGSYLRIRGGHCTCTSPRGCQCVQRSMSTIYMRFDVCGTRKGEKRSIAWPVWVSVFDC
jgi:hypothetical protein